MNRRGNGKRMIKGLGIATGGILFCYLTGVLLFSNRFPFRTYVDGKSVFFSSIDEVSLDKLYDTRLTTMTFLLPNDTKIQVPFSDLGIYKNADVDVTKIVLQPWKWPATLFSDTYYTLDDKYQYDENYLKKSISELNFMQSDVTSENVTLSAKNGKFTISNAYDALHLNPDTVLQKIKDALHTQNYTVSLTNCYEDTIFDTAIQQICNKGNHLLQHEIVLNCKGATESIPMSVKEDALYYQSGEFQVHESVIREYVSSLAKKYNTDGKNWLFQTTAGEVLTIKPSGKDSLSRFCMNQADTIVRVCDLLLGKDVPNDVVWSSEGVSHAANTDIGNSYVEISIEKQHLWYYENGVCLIDTDVTTGKSLDELDTPTGVFQVLQLATDYTMYGSYGSAFVHYFIKVTKDGVAIHDASWRNVYGGEEYKTNGSHGCINTPYDAVSKLYELLNAKQTDVTPVIIY